MLEVHLDVARGVAQHGEPRAAQHPADLVALARDVDRVGVGAEVTEVDVVVVPEQATLPDGPEQGAAGDEGLQPQLALEHRGDLLGVVEQPRRDSPVAVAECPAEPAPLVDDEVAARVVDDREPAVATQAHLVRGAGRAARGTQGDRGAAAQVRVERGRPGDAPCAVRVGAELLEAHREQAAPVDEHVDRSVVRAGGDDDAGAVGPPDVRGRPRGGGARLPVHAT